MKLSRSLSVIAFITVFCLLFVWQQTEIFRLAYAGQNIDTEFKNALDKNSILRYNLKTNTSLTRIYGKISTSDDFRQPDAYMLVKLSSPETTSRLARRSLLTKEENLFARIFGMNSSAEAKTITSGNTQSKIITITTSP